MYISSKLSLNKYLAERMRFIYSTTKTLIIGETIYNESIHFWVMCLRSTL